jgi:hypothetical protein
MMNQGESLRLAGKAAALLVFCLFSTVAEAGSTTYNVRANGDIQAAIDGAQNGDTIQLAAGTYNITTTIDPGGKQVTIIGTVDGNGAPTSILDGGNPVGGTSGVRVLICQNGETSTTVFENLVIQNGYTSSDGGGMYNTSSSPTLTNCAFTSNSADYKGGGMLNYSSSPTLTNCTFEGNAAYDYGGGMYNYGSSPNLANCTFESNSASDSGGGMVNALNCSPTLTDCTFTSNSANNSGGGMVNALNCSSTLTNCTFTSNSAGNFGGGMHNSSSSPTLTGCNFCGNTSASGNANINGDAIDGSSSGNLLLLNCNTGDVNFDLAINSGDLGYLLALWGASSVLNADINQDGVVNGADLSYILGYFGGTTDSTTAP